MAAGGHFGYPKLTFDGISGHFRSIRNFFFKIFLQNGHRRPFWMSEIHFWTHFWPFQIDMQLFLFLIFDNMTAVDHISGHFRSIRNYKFNLFFLQNDRRRSFWMSEIHFRSHFWPFQIDTQHFYFFENFWQNGCRRPFWMSEIHFRSHFWPF